MRSLLRSVEFRLTVHRSEFLGLLYPLVLAEDARTFLRTIRGRFADASHVVHAFRVGKEGSETLGCSDDGEPSGTAGKPILEILKGGSGGGNSALFVVRWYGGVKLGTGGLVRAYSETAKSVLAQATWEVLRDWARLQVVLPLSFVPRFRQGMAHYDVKVKRELFSSQASVDLEVPVETVEAFCNWLRDLTRGQALLSAPH